MYIYIHILNILTGIGRTGRAGRVGKAVTFLTDQDIPIIGTLATIVNDSQNAQEEYGKNHPNSALATWVSYFKKLQILHIQYYNMY